MNDEVKGVIQSQKISIVMTTKDKEESCKSWLKFVDTLNEGKEKPMEPKTTNQLIQEIINKKSEEYKKLGLPASYTPSWTTEEVMHVAIRTMHERVVGGGVDSKREERRANT